MEDHLAKTNHLSMKNLRVKGSSFVASTDRKTSLLRDRSAGRAVKRVQDMGVGLSSSLSTTAERSPLHDVRQPAPRKDCVARIQAHGRAHNLGNAMISRS